MATRPYVKKAIATGPVMPGVSDSRSSPAADLGVVPAEVGGPEDMLPDAPGKGMPAPGQPTGMLTPPRPQNMPQATPPPVPPQPAQPLPQPPAPPQPPGLPGPGFSQQPMPAQRPQVMPTGLATPQPLSQKQAAAKLGEIEAASPLVAAFLRRCVERGMTPGQIKEAATRACEIEPIREEFEKAAMWPWLLTAASLLPWLYSWWNGQGRQGQPATQPASQPTTQPATQQQGHPAEELESQRFDVDPPAGTTEQAVPGAAGQANPPRPAQATQPRQPTKLASHRGHTKKALWGQVLSGLGHLLRFLRLRGMGNALLSRGIASRLSGPFTGTPGAYQLALQRAQQALGSGATAGQALASARATATGMPQWSAALAKTWFGGNQAAAQNFLQRYGQKGVDALSAAKGDLAKAEQLLGYAMQPSPLRGLAGPAMTVGTLGAFIGVPHYLQGKEMAAMKAEQEGEFDRAAQLAAAVSSGDPQQLQQFMARNAIAGNQAAALQNLAASPYTRPFLTQQDQAGTALRQLQRFGKMPGMTPQTLTTNMINQQIPGGGNALMEQHYQTAGIPQGTEKPAAALRKLAAAALAACKKAAEGDDKADSKPVGPEAVSHRYRPWEGFDSSRPFLADRRARNPFQPPRPIPLPGETGWDWDSPEGRLLSPYQKRWADYVGGNSYDGPPTLDQSLLGGMSAADRAKLQQQLPPAVFDAMERIRTGRKYPNILPFASGDDAGVRPGSNLPPGSSVGVQSKPGSGYHPTNPANPSYGKPVPPRQSTPYAGQVKPAAALRKLAAAALAALTACKKAAEGDDKADSKPVGPDEEEDRLDPDLKARIDKGKQRWIPDILQTLNTPVENAMASPLKTGLINALLFGGLGGGVAAASGASPLASTGIGLGAAGLLGLGGGMGRYMENEDLTAAAARSKKKRPKLFDVYNNLAMHGQVVSDPLYTKAGRARPLAKRAVSLGVTAPDMPGNVIGRSISPFGDSLAAMLEGLQGKREPDKAWQEGESRRKMVETGAGLGGAAAGLGGLAHLGMSDNPSPLLAALLLGAGGAGASHWAGGSPLMTAGAGLGAGGLGALLAHMRRKPKRDKEAAALQRPTFRQAR